MSTSTERLGRNIQARFDEFGQEHPEVYALFRQFAQEVRLAGHRKFSADAILHRIRWEYDVNRRRDGGFKINDHFSSRYARRLMTDDRSFVGFFETRELKNLPLEG